MPKTLAVEATAMVQHISLHWQPVPRTVHLFGKNQLVKSQRKERRQCHHTIYLLESMYNNVSFIFYLSHQFLI